MANNDEMIGKLETALKEHIFPVLQKNLDIQFDFDSYADNLWSLRYARCDKAENWTKALGMHSGMLAPNFFEGDWVAFLQTYRPLVREDLEQIEQAAHTNSGPRNALANFERLCYQQAADTLATQKYVDDFFVGAAIAKDYPESDTLLLIAFESGILGEKTHHIAKEVGIATIADLENPEKLADIFKQGLAKQGLAKAITPAKKSSIRMRH